MIRIVLISLLAGACAFAQTSGAPAGQAWTGAPGPQAAPPPVQQPAYNPDNVASDAAVVVVHGVCPNNAVPANADACKMVITKQQFMAMIGGMNVASQLSTPSAMRSFAESYSQLLALASAGEKAGEENDPHFQELMRIARIRALAETYRHSLEEKYSNPSQQEIEAYYKENIDKYEALKVERIIVPTANFNRAPAARAEYDKKVQQLAADIRERAAKGEETQKLQDEAYKALNLPSSPRTDLGMKRRGGLPAAIEKDLFALKPGEVTKLETEPSGLNVYKLRSRDTIPVQYVRDEIVRDLHKRNLEAAIKSVTGAVHAELNDQFFGPTGGRGGPMLRTPQPSDKLFPKAVTTSTPLGATSAPNTQPANTGPAAASPANTAAPASPKPASPK
ncbi:MAG TPA: peptidylprolyl isomerase [Candidatus Angelobacter sp.]|nr:peptidylprolyl isomerase [Candidatus Angelobacter sp.]